MDTLVGMGILTAYVYSTVLLFFPQLISIYNLPANLYFDATIIVSGFVFWGKYLEALISPGYTELVGIWETNRQYFKFSVAMLL